ncbi:MAG: hypothetical protein VZR09_10265 [Candidatus Gastranaerophilaceae bacterium]|nr:hypothetical protein [Candidatus Gastranaerophilaceae bacterium]
MTNITYNLVANDTTIDSGITNYPEAREKAYILNASIKPVYKYSEKPYVPRGTEKEFEKIQYNHKTGKFNRIKVKG